MTTDNLNQRLKRSNLQLFKWTISWLISLAVVAFGPKFIWDYAPIYTVLIIAINVFFGYKIIISNKKLLETMDELQRRIHLNAMAITLGVAVVFGAVYGLLENIRLVSFTPSPSGILIVMAITYMICTLVGVRKYA